MRKLVYFAIGFGAACALSVYYLPTALLLPLAVLLLLLGTGLLLSRKKDWRRVTGMILLGIAAGQLWYGFYDMLLFAPARALDEQVLELTFTAGDYSYDTDYGIGVDGTAEIQGRSYQIRIYLNDAQPLAPGDRVTGTFRLRYTAPGAMEEPTYHSGNGVLFLGYPKGKAEVEINTLSHWKYAPAHLRQRILSLLDELFAADTRGFAKALLLGDTSELGYDVSTDLSVSGLRHVAAVSGLHVSILFSVIYLFIGKRRVLTALIGIPVLMLFAAMAGFSASIVRAGIMQCLMLLALALKREYDPPTALAFAALVILVWNPLSITSVGFQLSVASVAGIFLFAKRIHKWLTDKKRLGKWNGKKPFGWILNRISASVSISLGALISTTPLTAVYFGSVSLLSTLTNILCLWVITLLFCGIIVSLLLALLWLPAAKGLAWILSWLVRYVLGVSGAVASVPFAAVYTESIYVVAWLVLCYCLLGIFLLSKEKRPGILLCCAVLSLCAALLASWTEPLLDDYRVTVLDVGQGQCVLLQSDGRTYMVDCGGDYDVEAADLAASTLLSQGIAKLDGLILTHYDNDHVGAAAYLLHRVPAQVLILPDVTQEDYWEQPLFDNHTGQVVRGEDDIQISWEDSVITVYPGKRKVSGNESSLCVLFHTEKCDILITGDRDIMGEQILLKEAALPQLDALVVGHHGAATSTGEGLLEALKPRYALISVGEGNRYGHPDQEVLDRLTHYGCIVRRTDREGTICFRG